MGELVVSQDVAVGDISLDQRHFFHAHDSLLVTIDWASKGFKSRNKAFPRVLGDLLLSSVIGTDDKLDEDIWQRPLAILDNLL